MGQVIGNGINPGEIGVLGESLESTGVHGIGYKGAGVAGTSNEGNGGWFESNQGEGVRGWSKNPNHGGVVGINTGGGNGGWFESESGEGVRGWSKGPNRSGVIGINDSQSPGGNGGWFESAFGEGLRGLSKNKEHAGVVGINTAGGIGVHGISDNHEGVHAETHSFTTAALATVQMNKLSESAALYAKHAGNLTAAFFQGNVVVTGDIILTNAADCAEDFDISSESVAEPGTVMVIDDESKLRESFNPYDKRVAGVISGAGGYKPGLILDKKESSNTRKPIALLGKVFCKVDAEFGAIEVGDLLTTSPTAGHAMRVNDPLKAFGAVIGKALRPQTNGKGLIPILIALQ